METGNAAGEGGHLGGRRAWDGAAASGVSLDEWLARKAEELALPEMPTPDQRAGGGVFLLSELAAAVTGQKIAVNGGQWTTQ